MKAIEARHQGSPGVNNLLITTDFNDRAKTKKQLSAIKNTTLFSRGRKMSPCPTAICSWNVIHRNSSSILMVEHATSCNAETHQLSIGRGRCRTPAYDPDSTSKWERNVRIRGGREACWNGKQEANSLGDSLLSLL